MRFRGAMMAGLFAAVALPRLFAPPPLITGDVPTADARHFELYTGIRYQDTGTVERQLPHVELVYGISKRWEVSTEVNYLSHERARGADDVTLATKFMFLTESVTTPGLAASYEYKVANGNAARGLGSGGTEHEFRLRAQKTFGWFTPILNAGYAAVPDVWIAGRREFRQGAWRTSFAQEWRTNERMRLLSELYWQAADEPGDSARLGWNIGFKHRLREGLSWHGAIGEGLRTGNRGGPDLRVYLGLKFEFAASAISPF